MADLLVFDLQRFALHDGPGIRTTVFLKGCPLNCLWCHNPESKSRKPQLGYLEKKCSRCGKCQQVCERGIHRFSKTGEHEIAFRQCALCRTCVEACPNRALKIFGQTMTQQEILEIVMRDLDFYQRSGGGLTVSGGEPMLQTEGLQSLLEAAKEKGLHVCLDTSGQARQEDYERILPYVDLFLFDYKMTSPELHQRYIGSDGILIKQNLEFLCRKGCAIYLRCPIIPGINDEPEHYRAIAKWAETYDSIRQVNLMPYHDMAKGKSAQIGAHYAMGDQKTVEAEEKQRIYDAVRAAGCRKLAEG